MLLANLKASAFGIYMVVSTSWGVLVAGVHVVKALLFRVHIKAPDLGNSHISALRKGPSYDPSREPYLGIDCSFDPRGSM